jgi:hypothetical protein
MEMISILAAAAASFAYGAAHYTILSKTWARVAGLKLDGEGKPTGEEFVGKNPATPFILGFLAMILVAGMMRHIFAMAQIVEIGKSVISGAGIGAFFIAPWTMMNNAYPGRPFLLTVIDGAYAIIGCGIIGLVLALI